MNSMEPKQKIIYPDQEELVVATITRVQNYGAFAKLDEYAGCEGMIHISEISSRWIKNINDHVREGQKVVLKVLRVDAEKGHIELSLKSVKAAQRKEVLDQHKKEQRARKLIELTANKLKETEKAEEIVQGLYAKFDSPYKVLELTLTEGEKAFEGLKISDEWKEALVKTAKEYIEPPRVYIKANLEIESRASNGIEIIRDSLTKAKKEKLPKDVELEIKYLGAPKYSIELSAPNYKIAEQVFGKITDNIASELKKGAGSVKINR